MNNNIFIYNDIVKELQSALDNKRIVHSLFTGNWGSLLYLFYYEQYLDDSKEHAASFLDKLYNELTIHPDMGYAYSTGLTGLYWLLNHLNKHEFIEVDIDRLAAPFISKAIARSEQNLAEKDFDFLYGSAGICNLLVDFAGRDDVRVHLEKFVEGVGAIARRMEKGTSLPVFYLYQDPPTKEGIEAFSLAHGSCALQIILMKIHKANIAKSACEQLIYESMSFMLHSGRKLQESDLAGSLYPPYLNPDKETASSRVSWCYGDMNVALSLWYCGKYFKESKWMDRAVEILHHNTKRNSCASAGIADACLCHGTGGNAAIYRRFWHETNEKAFYKCSEDWYALTASMISFSDDPGIHGIRNWQGSIKQWEYSSNLLAGSSGTGLSLLSRNSDTALPWDELLLISP